ncbi:MAG: hypothetical protein COA79_15205 [Planctomycetota bacterium]|nr:MAG: hypothetical protein COA79_15205 [Planctomycetota bacterium]
MKSTVLIFMILIITKTAMFANEENFSLGYWTIDAKKYGEHFDKKMNTKNSDEKKKKIFAKYKAIGLKYIKLTVVEIRESKIHFHQGDVKKSTTVGSFVKVKSDSSEFKPNVDKKKRLNILFKKNDDQSVTYTRGNAVYVLTKMDEEAAKKRIAEFKVMRDKKSKKK